MSAVDLSFTCARCGERKARYAVGRETGAPICKHCYVRDLRVPEALAKKSVISAVIRALEPGLRAETIDAAIDEAAGTIHGLSVLVRQITTIPDALTGSPAATARVYRLAARLIEGGARNLALPACAGCGSARSGRMDRTCSRCTTKARPHPPCSRCGVARRVRARTPEGPVCGSCWSRDPQTWRECSRCGQLGRVNSRDEGGRAICIRCYVQPSDLCDGCGKKRPISSRSDGRALCAPCYVRIGPKKPCGRCGRTRRIARKATDTEPQLCHACWFEPLAVCSRCGDEGMCNGIKKGEPLCQRCRLKDHLAKLVLHALIAGDRSGVPEWFEPLREAIVSVDNPRSAFVWLGRSPGVGVLHDLVAGILPRTHEALDQLPQTPSLRHLRDLLVATGALPARDSNVAVLERAATEIPATLDHPEDRRFLEAFARWRVLNRARARAEQGKFTTLAAKNNRVLIAEAARFLAHLHAQGRSLSTCTQADVDAWTATGAKSRFRIRDFLVWAVQRRITGNFTPPTHPTKSRPTAASDAEARWAIAKRLLHDDSIDPADRVAGILVVLYAQPLTRIASLRLGDIQERDGELFVRFGRENVLMPEPLATFMRQLPWRRQVGISGLVGSKDWLFPGRQAGRHQHPEFLRLRLAALGIECRSNRNAALLQLGAEIPPVVLADTLGMHRNTATRWVQMAGGDWSRYAADKSRELISSGEGGA